MMIASIDYDGNITADCLFNMGLNTLVFIADIIVSFLTQIFVKDNTNIVVFIGYKLFVCLFVNKQYVSMPKTIIRFSVFVPLITRDTDAFVPAPFRLPVATVIRYVTFSFSESAEII